jgi:hypothetical protein
MPDAYSIDAGTDSQIADKNSFANELLKTAKINQAVLPFIKRLNALLALPTNKKTMQDFLRLSLQNFEKPQKDFIKLLLLADAQDVQRYFDQNWEAFYNKEEMGLIMPVDVRDDLVNPLVSKLQQILPTYDDKMEVVMAIDSRASGGTRRLRRRRGGRKTLCPRIRVRSYKKRNLRRTMRRLAGAYTRKQL